MGKEKENKKSKETKIISLLCGEECQNLVRGMKRQRIDVKKDGGPSAEEVISFGLR